MSATGAPLARPTEAKYAPDELVRGCQHIAAGAVHSGVLGSNANSANMVAAIFTATGQDIACVHESSVGQFILERRPDGVYASMTLPSLAIGTVGGGTHLPAQHELLEAMGCTGRGSTARLAEIIAGFALALDLSTVSTAVSGQFASAHERLGRNRPVRWFQLDELDPDFFESAHLPMGPSVLSELTSRTVKKAVGLFPMQLRVDRGDVEESWTSWSRSSPPTGRSSRWPDWRPGCAAARWQPTTTDSRNVSASSGAM
ncbi:hypothetical protein AB0C13_27830 [Streptomyces sp. NPDC049099]|uniref:hypothetical protein n=1 Tax=Streptomyces sp. NPDC049099 TaxID=3155768 RepID=UPI00343C665C